MTNLDGFGSLLPDYFRRAPALIDSLETETSVLQADTVGECLPLLNAVEDPSRNPFDLNDFGVPRLEREKHIDFLRANLKEFPAPFVGLDASRPWMVYWALVSLYMLGEDVSHFRPRYHFQACLRTGSLIEHGHLS